MFMKHYLLTRKSMLKKPNKQTSVDILLKRVIPFQKESQAGPSRGIPKEGIVAIGDGGSILPLKPSQWDKGGGGDSDIGGPDLV